MWLQFISDAEFDGQPTFLANISLLPEKKSDDELEWIDEFEPTQDITYQEYLEASTDQQQPLDVVDIPTGSTTDQDGS